jgi:hypothetical protein
MRNGLGRRVAEDRRGRQEREGSKHQWRCGGGISDAEPGTGQTPLWQSQIHTNHAKLRGRGLSRSGS